MAWHPPSMIPIFQDPPEKPKLKVESNEQDLDLIEGLVAIHGTGTHKEAFATIRAAYEELLKEQNG